jgi:hypothetical protein
MLIMAEAPRGPDVITHGAPDVITSGAPVAYTYMYRTQRCCPTDPVAESLTVLQSNLQQSMTDREGGRATKALA